MSTFRTCRIPSQSGKRRLSLDQLKKLPNQALARNCRQWHWKKSRWNSSSSSPRLTDFVLRVAAYLDKKTNKNLQLSTNSASLKKRVRKTRRAIFLEASRGERMSKLLSNLEQIAQRQNWETCKRIYLSLLGYSPRIKETPQAKSQP